MTSWFLYPTIQLWQINYWVGGEEELGLTQGNQHISGQWPLHSKVGEKVGEGNGPIRFSLLRIWARKTERSFQVGVESICGKRSHEVGLLVYEVSLQAGRNKREGHRETERCQETNTMWPGRESIRKRSLGFPQPLMVFWYQFQAMLDPFNSTFLS